VGWIARRGSDERECESVRGAKCWQIFSVSDVSHISSSSYFEPTPARVRRTTLRDENKWNPAPPPSHTIVDIMDSARGAGEPETTERRQKVYQSSFAPLTTNDFKIINAMVASQVEHCSFGSKGSWRTSWCSWITLGKSCIQYSKANYVNYVLSAPVCRVRLQKLVFRRHSNPHICIALYCIVVTKPYNFNGIPTLISVECTTWHRSNTRV